MTVRLLDLKAYMTRAGVRTMDFLDASFEVNYLAPELRVNKVLIAQDEHVARPDLLSNIGYGAPDYVDVVLKFNQVTNPFSIEEGRLVLIPDLGSVERFYARRATSASAAQILDTKSLFIDPTRASRKDEARLRELAKIAARRRSGASEIKPSNLLRSGEKPFEADGTALRLAPNAVRR